ncbi:MAG: hypothetical protein ACK5N1_15475, partial [Gemmatimonas sp.]
MATLFSSLRRCATALALTLPAGLQAQQVTLDTRDPNQKQDPTYEQSLREWLANPRHSSPLVDHLPLAPGIPTPRDV